MWEWDVQVLDIQEGTREDQKPACLGGRGATPPEFCGGPTGYRLMLKRQKEGNAMLAPTMVETGIQLLAKACPGHRVGPFSTCREQSIDVQRAV
jgi:hypothetical protein